MAQSIKAAVVNDFKSPPSYQSIEIAAPTETQNQVSILAAGLHPLVRARASGMHYSADIKPPLIPGIDGVGRLANGDVVYVMAFAPGSTGTFAERANVRKEDCLILPKGANPNTIAALVNPGMPSWIGLRARASPRPGFSVLILGVTGSAGQMGIHISKFLGASRVIGLGRNQQVLSELQKNGLDAAIPLTDDEATKQLIIKEAANVDVVLDFLWGHPAEIAMNAIIAARTDKAQRLDWVQCGASAGPNINFPAAILRMSNFFVSGTGLGPLPPASMRSEIVSLIDMLARGEPPVSIDVKQLADAEKAWSSPAEGRIVFKH